MIVSSLKGPISRLLRTDQGWGVSFVVLFLTALVGWILIVSVGLSDVWRARADATADWLVASALVDGRDPHGNLYELAATYNVDFWDPDDVTSRVRHSPRTPGALVLLAPLSLFGSEDALPALLIAGLIMVGLSFVALSRSGELSLITLFAGLGFVLTAGPARWSYLFGSQSQILFALLAVSTLLLLKRNSAAGGLLLGIASTLKLFPLLLLVVLIAHRRYRASSWTLGTVAVLNLAPLTLPNVSFSGTMGTLTSSVTGWLDLEANISLMGAADRILDPPSWILLAAQVVLTSIAVLMVFRWRRPLTVDLAVVTAFAILMSPLAWPHYLLIFVGPVLLAMRTLGISAKLVIGLAAVLTLPVGGVVLYSVALVVAVVGLAYRSPQGSQEFDPQVAPLV